MKIQKGGKVIPEAFSRFFITKIYLQAFCTKKIVHHFISYLLCTNIAIFASKHDWKMNFQSKASDQDGKSLRKGFSFSGMRNISFFLMVYHIPLERKSCPQELKIILNQFSSDSNDLKRLSLICQLGSTR